MGFVKRTFRPVALATAWIAASQFARNELLFKSLWTAHEQRLGPAFPSGPVNGAVWGLWSLLFAIAIHAMARKLTRIETALLAWFVGFVLMRVVLGNLGVLPFGLLVFAVPLSLLESFIAAWIVQKVS